MFERSLLTDGDVEQLGQAATTVLEKVGALYQNQHILEALDANGAKVDYARQVATFPKEMTREFLDAIRKETPPADDSGHRRFSAPGMGGMFHQLSQYFYDYETRERRLGNKADYIQMIKLGDVLYRESGVGQCMLLSDVPAPVEPLESTLLQFEYAHRPRGAYVQDVRQIDYLHEMEDISGVQDLVWLANVGFSSPLRLGKDIADRFVYAIKKGRPASLYVMTVSGAGTPVTVAGTIAACAAEFLANWMAARALNPDCGLGAGAWIATMDMRTGEASYSACDAMIRNFSVREFMRRWTGVHIGAGGAVYNAAKVPGLYSALEKAHCAMTVAAFTGSHTGVVSGHLDGGLTISPVQLVLDIEMAKALAHLGRPIEVNEETIGLDTMLAVGHAEDTNYMESEHTLRHFRSSLWLPEIMERPGWAGAETEERVLDKAQQRVNELIAAYEKPQVDEDMLAKLRAVVAKARKHLL